MNRTSGPHGPHGAAPAALLGHRTQSSVSGPGSPAPGREAWPGAARLVAIPHADTASLRALRRASKRALKAAKRKVPWPAVLRCTAHLEDVPGPEALSRFRIEVIAPRDPERFLDRAEQAFRARFQQRLARPRWLSWLG